MTTMKLRIENENKTTTETKLLPGTTRAQAIETAATLKSVGARSVQLFTEGKPAEFI